MSAVPPADRRLRAYVERILASTKNGEEGRGLLDDSAFAQRAEAAPLARDEREREAVRRAHAKLVRGEALDAEESGLYEAIVLPAERPAIVVEGGTIIAAPPPWEGLRQPAILRRIERAIAAVGRVELRGTAGRSWTGTAFVAGRGLLMTNRHVARDFASGEGRHVRFRDGAGAVVDFHREGDARGRDVPIARVVLIHPHWDMALLAVEGLSVAPLSLLPEDPEDCRSRQIAVVGHPGRDDSVPAALLQRVFGEQFGIKRVQPGTVMGEGPYAGRERTVRALLHDSSTLGGNSGSAVIDLATGDVLGLHFAGAYLVANYAVPSSELARDPFLREAGVAFTKDAPPDPNPWERAWREAEATVAPPRAGPAARTVAPAAVSQRDATRPAGPAQVVHRVTLTLDVHVRIVDGQSGQRARGG